MDVLIDTNIILDSILERKPYCISANKIIDLCCTGVITGCVAAHTISNLFFILRKNMSADNRKKLLLELCDEMTVVSLDSQKIISALKNDKFDDFEDCLQDECAVEFNADYLITRNTSDFEHSKIKAVKPEDFLKIVDKVLK